MTKRGAKSVHQRKGCALGALRLPTLLRTHECISAPKLKTHVLTEVTLACKNQRGML